MALIGSLIGSLLKSGSLTLISPDGSRNTYGPGGGKSLTVRFADRKVSFDIARNPRLAFGEAYMDGRLTIEGSARDAADLSEFTRRLRASVWFGEIPHPNYERADSKTRDREDTQRHLTWKLSDVAVRRWN